MWYDLQPYSVFHVLVPGGVCVYYVNVPVLGLLMDNLRGGDLLQVSAYFMVSSTIMSGECRCTI